MSQSQCRSRSVAVASICTDAQTDKNLFTTPSTTSSCDQTYLDNKEKRDKRKSHLLDDRRVDRDSLESSWSNREQYLLVDVLEDRHDNERTNGKEEGSCERKQHMSVFRFHEFRKARSKGPNELEDTSNMNRGRPWSTSSSSHHLATYRQYVF